MSHGGLKAWIEAKAQAADAVSRNQGTGDACVRLLIGIDRATKHLKSI